MTADHNSDADVAALLRRVHTFAVVGASNKAERPSYGVVRSLIERGYVVYPVNPGLAGQEILGQLVFSSLAEVPAPVDVVDIFRNSDDALAIVREAIRLKSELRLQAVWMQLGVINETAREEALAAGLMAVMDRCPRIEFFR